MARKIALDNLNNTRELGGLPGVGGKEIKHDTLYRSGHLFPASERDLEILNSLNLSHVIDLRSPLEQEQKPDPTLINSKHILLSTVTDELSGITRDEASDRNSSKILIMRMAGNEQLAIQYMDELYENLVTNNFCLSQYNKFLKLMASDESDKVLWHCTAGKDRAGLATVFMLEILGVPRQLIIENYLETNKNLKGEIDDIIEMIKKEMPLKNGEAAIRSFFGAKEDYIMSMYKIVDEKYGDFKTFLKNGLKVDDYIIGNIREKYLC